MLYNIVWKNGKTEKRKLSESAFEKLIAEEFDEIDSIVEDEELEENGFRNSPFNMVVDELYDCIIDQLGAEAFEMESDADDTIWSAVEDFGSQISGFKEHLTEKYVEALMQKHNGDYEYENPEDLEEGFKDNLHKAKKFAKTALATVAVAGGLMGNPADAKGQETEQPVAVEQTIDGHIIDQYGNKWTIEEFEKLEQGIDPYYDGATKPYGKDDVEESVEFNVETIDNYIQDNFYGDVILVDTGIDPKTHKNINIYEYDTEYDEKDIKERLSSDKKAKKIASILQAEYGDYAEFKADKNRIYMYYTDTLEEGIKDYLPRAGFIRHNGDEKIGGFIGQGTDEQLRKAKIIAKVKFANGDRMGRVSKEDLENFDEYYAEYQELFGLDESKCGKKKAIKEGLTDYIFEPELGMKYAYDLATDQQLDGLARALDMGENKDIQRELCKYVDSVAKWEGWKDTSKLKEKIMATDYVGSDNGLYESEMPINDGDVDKDVLDLEPSTDGWEMLDLSGIMAKLEKEESLVSDSDVEKQDTNVETNKGKSEKSEEPKEETSEKKEIKESANGKVVLHIFSAKKGNWVGQFISVAKAKKFLKDYGYDPASDYYEIHSGNNTSEVDGLEEWSGKGGYWYNVLHSDKTPERVKAIVARKEVKSGISESFVIR